MRTSEAVTNVRGIWASLLAYTAIYVMLGVIVVVLMLQLFRASPNVGGGES
jgi:cytochrome d ubiquinol oxidase subunit I